MGELWLCKQDFELERIAEMKDFAISCLKTIAGLILLILFALPCLILFAIACVPMLIYEFTPMGRRERRIIEEQTNATNSICKHREMTE